MYIHYIPKVFLSQQFDKIIFTRNTRIYSPIHYAMPDILKKKKIRRKNASIHVSIASGDNESGHTCTLSQPPPRSKKWSPTIWMVSHLKNSPLFVTSLTHAWQDVTTPLCSVFTGTYLDWHEGGEFLPNFLTRVTSVKSSCDLLGLSGSPPSL